MGDLEEEGATLGSQLRNLRWMSIVLAAWNLAVILIGGCLTVSVSPICAGRDRLSFVVVSLIAIVRIVYMVGAAKAQRATAVSIVGHSFESASTIDPVSRHERRMRYKRWLWWTRFGLAVTALQFLIAFYLLIIIVRDFSLVSDSAKCFMGQHPKDGDTKQMLLISFLVLVWLVVIVQCFTGSDVLRWRSFYATHDTAWKAHYQEVFDHGIREALCCMGRAKYLSVLEEDEIYSVARLLGDLVAYRASGTGHLELLAGLALLQKHKQHPKLYNELVEAPEARTREAAVIHPFAEAAYTGPLLDFGRNPILFPCAWLQRQGILTPWTRSRRPVLEGDNWWRGHAAAFLKYVNLPSEALRRGRVCQTRREAAYFLVVVHDLRSVVIAVRGTETPEDLITDGLCKECTLTVDDLDGLINGYQVPSHVRENVLSSFPHYGHSGIVESARELFMQIDGQPGGDGSPSETYGFLSSLLGNGGECHGYNVRIVGHSLGGAVAALLGLRLYGRYPNLHVYAYGPLPCVDSVIAEACSDFVTSIVYNDEFSARLSVNSILRLRAAAIGALSVDSSGDSAMIGKLVRRILHVKKYHGNEEIQISPASANTGTIDIVEDDNHVYKRKHFKNTVKGGVFLCGYAVSCVVNSPDHRPVSRIKDDCQLSSSTESEPVVPELCHKGPPIFDDPGPDILNDGIHECSNSSAPICDFLSYGNQVSQYLDSSPAAIEVPRESPEVFLPGLIIHIVPEVRSILPLWKSWRASERGHIYNAFVTDRESFKDIVVSPYMFLDHLPWRCQYALQRVLESQKSQGQSAADILDEANIV